MTEEREKLYVIRFEERCLRKFRKRLLNIGNRPEREILREPLGDAGWIIPEIIYWMGTDSITLKPGYSIKTYGDDLIIEDEGASDEDEKVRGEISLKYVEKMEKE